MNKDGLPELPNELNFEQWYCENAFHFERDPIGSRDCELQRKAWHAALAAMQAGEPVAYWNGLKKAQSDIGPWPTFSMEQNECTSIPLFTRPQATSKAEAMLAFVLENGLPIKGTRIGYWYEGQPGLPFETQRDAIRAAMKGES